MLFENILEFYHYRCHNRNLPQAHLSRESHCWRGPTTENLLKEDYESEVGFKLRCLFGLEEQVRRQFYIRIEELICLRMQIL